MVRCVMFLVVAAGFVSGDHGDQHRSDKAVDSQSRESVHRLEAKMTASPKMDRHRVAKHLTHLLRKAPTQQHKDDISQELGALAARDAAPAQPSLPPLSSLSLSPSSSASEVTSWYGYPSTLDWIVDLYFLDFESDDGGEDDDGGGGSSSGSTATPVILDSGSSNLAVAVSGCTSCGAACSASLDALPFAEPHGCLTVAYGSGAWSGEELAATSVGLSRRDLAATMSLAGITSQSGFFTGGAAYSGILGMAYEELAEDYQACTDAAAATASWTSAAAASVAGDARSSSPLLPPSRAEYLSRKVEGGGEEEDEGEENTAALSSSSSTSSGTVAAVPFMYALAESGTVAANAFAVAMCGDTAAVSLGGIDASMHTAEVRYVATQRTFGLYYGYYLAYATGVTVGGSPVAAAAAAGAGGSKGPGWGGLSGSGSGGLNAYGGVVVDTGTTLHYLPPRALAGVQDLVAAAVGDLPAHFFEWGASVEAAQLDGFPDVVYSFASSADKDEAATVDVVLVPRQYLLEYGGAYYWGFDASSLPILGNIGMNGKAVVFDVDQNRLGFAEGACETAGGESAFQPILELSGTEAQSQDGKASGRGKSLAVNLVSMAAVVAAVLASAYIAVIRMRKPTAHPTQGARYVQARETEALLPPL